MKYRQQRPSSSGCGGEKPLGAIGGALAGGIGGSRVIRSAVVAIREYAYFQAAQSIGCSRWGTLSRHVLPNIMPVIIVSFSISIGGVIMGWLL